MAYLFRPKTLIKAGYRNLPVHCDRTDITEEWVRVVVETPEEYDFRGFPRYHLVKTKEGKWDFHYDKYAHHGRSIPGSILGADSWEIKAETYRMRVLLKTV